MSVDVVVVDLSAKMTVQTVFVSICESNQVFGGCCLITAIIAGSLVKNQSRREGEVVGSAVL